MVIAVGKQTAVLKYCLVTAGTHVRLRANFTLVVLKHWHNNGNGNKSFMTRFAFGAIVEFHMKRNCWIQFNMMYSVLNCSRFYHAKYELCLNGFASAGNVCRDS